VSATVSLLLVRHAETAWNAAGRIQGHTDVSLSQRGRASLRRRRIPTEFSDFGWTASPLRRAMETARLLGGVDVRPEPRLMEMAWAEWEGQTREGLRERYGVDITRITGGGLDFRPPGGESPRRVQARLASWLADTVAEGRPRIVVTHKGVIRALLSLATGWDMTTKPPHRFDWDRGHLFEVDAAGVVYLVRPDIALTRSVSTGGAGR